MFQYYAILCIILVTTYLVFKYSKSQGKLPPGPWGLPIFGYALFFGPKPHETIAEMKKKYGDVIRMKVGRENVVFLLSYDAIKEALVKKGDIFSSRPIHNYPPQLRSTPGIIGSEGEMWSQFRRFSLSVLRDFGFGKSSLEPQMKEEIGHFLKELESYKGLPIPNINEIIHKSVFNVICVIMTGKRYNYDDETFCTLLNLLSTYISNLGINRLFDLIPFSARFLIRPFYKVLGIQTAEECGWVLVNYLSKIVDNFDEIHEPESAENFIDAWLSEVKSENKKNKYITKNQLPTVLLDLFLAGSDTTTNTLSWCLLYMIKYPEIQHRVQQEIDNVIGRERTPSMSDQKLLPYTEAVLMEVNRMVTIAPLALEHWITKDATIQDYFIPKNTKIVVNLWAVHHDPVVFKQPNEFKPERFLTDSGGIKKIEEFIPFSMGKRQCMGESLARMELFLYFTSMLQHFTFESIESTEVDFDYHFALVSVPTPQSLYAIPR